MGFDWNARIISLIPKQITPIVTNTDTNRKPKIGSVNIAIAAMPVKIPSTRRGVQPSPISFLMLIAERISMTASEANPTPVRNHNIFNENEWRATKATPTTIIKTLKII